MPYEIVIAADAEQDLKPLRRYDLKIILKAIEQHLSHQPKMVSRSRIRQLTQPAISEYRLMVGEYRVYYDVVDEVRHVVVLHVFKKGRRTTPRGGRS